MGVVNFLYEITFCLFFCLLFLSLSVYAVLLCGDLNAFCYEWMGHYLSMLFCLPYFKNLFIFESDDTTLDQFKSD